MSRNDEVFLPAVWIPDSLFKQQNVVVGNDNIGDCHGIAMQYRI